MALTLKQAADETGLSKPAILKAIQKGKISANKDHNGHWLIEPVELFRIYPKNNQVNEVNDNQLTTGNGNVSNELLIEIEVLREKNKIYTDRISELQDERDKWQEQAQKLLLTYEADKKSTEQKKEEISPKKQDQILLWLLPLITALGILLTMIALKNI